MNFTINKTDLIGQLTGIPLRVAQEMMGEQSLQGNKFDVTVFQKDLCATKRCGGFDWVESQRGKEFWKKVIHERRFDLCKPQIDFTYGEKVLVRQNELQEWQVKTFVAVTDNEVYPYLVADENDYYNKGHHLKNFESFSLIMKKTKIILQLTLKDIAKKYGVEQVKIVK